MNGVDAAILRTLLYGDTFQFAMTIEEIHRFLIHDKPLTRQTIAHALATSRDLDRVVCQQAGYVALRQRPHLIDLRIERETLTNQLWAPALRYGRWLAAIPFVRMVALTGALSVRNPMSLQDDFDYMLVVQPGRVWLARGLAVLLVRVGRLLGGEICPNYVVSVDRLRQQRQDLYIAHEIAQMIPLYGYEIYERLYTSNDWVLLHLPNSCREMGAPESGRQRFKRVLEWALSGRFGNWLEGLERRRKARRFAAQAKQPGASAEIDADSVKGHFDDHGLPILEAYRGRLRDYGLSDDLMAELWAAGD